MRRAGTAILRLTAALLALLVVAALVILLQPVLLTGRYYDLTVRSIEYGPLGNVTVTYDEVLTYGTSASWEYNMEKNTGGMVLQAWERMPPGFLRWPRRSRDQTFGFWLTTPAERAERMEVSPALRERLLLRQGTYRIRCGDHLDYYRRTAPDGTVVPWEIEVNPR